ncbi:MAG TPA: cobalamin-independent methionine synthase II family protein [Solirubrobacteraceae bacterium]|jgi:5-methyltetrahydropteroyltriglutamate--homocysteine methyltransferase|nr:cobalamin-independent methionine synthase II family protein [Solirubrobacteraceae bacterium]
MDRIPTTHVGSLIRPDSLLEAIEARKPGGEPDPAYERALKEAVDDVVRRQVEVGIDVVNDGEMGKSSWITYLYERISGLEARIVPLEGTSVLPPSRDRLAFPGFYAEHDRLDQENRASLDASDDEGPAAAADEEKRWVCTGPISYDPTAIRRDVADLKAALAPYDVVDAFLPVVAPASTYWLDNEHYASDEEFVYALADALHEEYKEIVDAGLLVQVDDAVLMHEADSILAVGGTWDDYLRWAQLRVDATNHALRGLPAERVRYHVCWGSWHGPHAFDPPLADVVDLILQVDAGAYAIEMANPRHEHEWVVFEDVRLPEGKKLIPGVVTHHTNVVEHPDLVAQRLVRLAGVVGRENVIAGTDCGFAQGAFIRRVHPEIQWAKLRSLVEGARIASRQLWGAAAAA